MYLIYIVIFWQCSLSYIVHNKGTITHLIFSVVKPNTLHQFRTINPEQYEINNLIACLEIIRLIHGTNLASCYGDVTAFSHSHHQIPVEENNKTTKIIHMSSGMRRVQNTVSAPRALGILLSVAHFIFFFFPKGSSDFRRGRRKRSASEIRLAENRLLSVARLNLLH